MRHRMKVGAALSVLSLLVVACATGPSHGTHGMDLSENTALLIQRGMSQSEVESLIGDPFRVTKMGDQEQWTYRYVAKRVDGKYVYRPAFPSTDPKKPTRYHGAIFILFNSLGKVGMVRRG